MDGFDLSSRIRGWSSSHIQLGLLPESGRIAERHLELNLFIVVLASLREPLANAMLLVPLLYLAKLTVFEKPHERQTTSKLSILDVMLFTGLVALALSWESLVASLFASGPVGLSFWARNEVFLLSLIPRFSIIMAITILIWGQCRSWRFSWFSLAGDCASLGLAVSRSSDESYCPSSDD